MQVLGVVAARAGSKGVRNKNLRPIAGEPLLAYMIRAAQRATSIDRLILTTEDEGIAEVGRSYGIEVPFKRPAALASDHATGIQVAKHAMEAMDALGCRADVVVHLFPTSPFVPPEKIDTAIRLTRGSYESAISVRRIEHDHPYRALFLRDDHSVDALLDHPAATKPVNRQDLPELHARCGGIFARRRHLLETWSGEDFALGTRCAGVPLSDIEAVNIDREIDFLFAEFIAERGLHVANQERSGSRSTGLGHPGPLRE